MNSADRYRNNILSFQGQLDPSRISFQHLPRAPLPATNVVISGMGGSGITGAIIAAARQELGISGYCTTWKSYGIPAVPSPSQTLFLFVSFSGNTEEVLSGIRQAKKKGLATAVVTTGGKLLAFAARHRIPSAVFAPEALVPRQATGLLVTAASLLLFHLGVAAKYPRTTAPFPASHEHTGEKLAKKLLSSKLILLYTAPDEAHFGLIWKAKLNETAKFLAFANTIPEMNHNEIVGFQRTKVSAHALFLVSRKTAKRVVARMQLTAELLKNLHIASTTLSLQG
ncbi:hypothetical protein D6779_11250, partial [Candidatus Parcubacteria bacterium]